MFGISFCLCVYDWFDIYVTDNDSIWSVVRGLFKINENNLSILSINFTSISTAKATLAGRVIGH